MSQGNDNADTSATTDVTAADQQVQAELVDWGNNDVVLHSQAYGDDPQGLRVAREYLEAREADDE